MTDLSFAYYTVSSFLKFIYITLGICLGLGCTSTASGNTTLQHIYMFRKLFLASDESTRRFSGMQ